MTDLVTTGIIPYSRISDLGIALCSFGPFRLFQALAHVPSYLALPLARPNSLPNVSTDSLFKLCKLSSGLQWESLEMLVMGCLSLVTTATVLFSQHALLGSGHLSVKMVTSLVP